MAPEPDPDDRLHPEDDELFDQSEEQESSSDFFRAKQTPAVLKHGILKRYTPPFVTKTGKYSPNNRVVIMDGFAGSGRYEDGSAGSPAIFVGVAEQTPYRKLECYFVEKDAGNYRRLRAMLDAEAGAITWEAWHGLAEDHVDDVLTRALGLPLFMFIDPFNIGPDFAQVNELFRRRPGGQGQPATELLFRVDAVVLLRILGILRSPSRYPAREGQIRCLDDVAGGTWWRDEDDGIRSGQEFLDWFAGRYVENLVTALGCGGWWIDIRRKPDHLPRYYLIFLTRHPDGIDIFGEAVSCSLDEWRRAVFDERLAGARDSGQLRLLDPEEEFKADERLLAERWQTEIEQNVRALLRQRERFRVRDFYGAVFGSATGQARKMHLRKALRRLAAAGVTATDSRGELIDKIVIRAPGVQP